MRTFSMFFNQADKLDPNHEHFSLSYTVTTNSLSRDLAFVGLKTRKKMKILCIISIALNLVNCDHFTDNPCPDRPVLENFQPEKVK